MRSMTDTVDRPVGLDQRRRRRHLVRASLLGLVLAYLAVLLIAPLGGIIWTVVKAGSDTILETFAQADVRHAFYLTMLIAVITVVVVTVFGVITAWVLARQRFLGRGLLNALVDLPFAVSPVTVGIMAVLLFGTGGWFADFFSARGIQIIFAMPSMVIVTIFIAINFMVDVLYSLLDPRVRLGAAAAH